MSQEFKKAFRGIDSAIKQGTARALNRALSSAKTKMVRALREETGLTNKVVNRRVLETKANQAKLRARLGIAIKVGIPLSEFSPKLKTSRVVHKGNRRATKHYGVSVKIGKQGRQLVPGGFLVSGRNSGKSLVLARKGKAPRPTVVLRTMLFTETAKAARAEAQRHMANTFNKDVSGYIDYEIKKRFTQNK